MDKEKWTPVFMYDINDLPDGTEIIWEKKIDVYEEKKIPTTSKGKTKMKKVKRLVGFRYEPYRTILSKYHHKTVSGYLPCLVEAPNSEFPYLTPWQSDWNYAGNGTFIQMWRRKDDDQQGNT